MNNIIPYAYRYVKICIDSKEDENGLPIKVSKLVYLEKPIPFRFLSKGVIGNSNIINIAINYQMNILQPLFMITRWTL